MHSRLSPSNASSIIDLPLSCGREGPGVGLTLLTLATPRVVNAQRGALLTAAIFLAVAIPVSAIRPLWLDEILQLVETRQPSTIRMIMDVRQTAGAAPLGFLLQHEVLKITGYSTVLARLPSALFGAATVFLIALLGAQFGLRRGWLPGVILGLCPLMLRYAAESRVYAQALFLSVLATYIYVRLAARPRPGVAVLYWFVLTAAVFTQPYAVCVGIAPVLCSVIRREYRAALMCGAGLLLALIAFLPWFAWAQAGWAASSATNRFQFSFSLKTPLMLFREFAGAGYWGSGLLVLLGAGALQGRALGIPDRVLLLLSISTVPAVVLCGDAWFGYFIAARQIIWILPAVAILAAAGIEQNRRAGLALAIMLAIICLRQSIVFFRSPGEDWQMAANVLADQVHQGNCLLVAPPQHAPLYEFFHPELGSEPCNASKIVLAITPAATSAQRRISITKLISAGYRASNARMVGRSEIVLFHRP
jgi:4-amino-4-deoxy-L-arabinose transferase-like glycosyltransferase